MPPGEEDTLKCGSPNKNLLPNDLNDIDLKSFHSLRYIELIQNEGEILFVPSGWHHQVWNLVVFVLNKCLKY